MQARGYGISFLCAAVEGLSLLSVRRQQTFLKMGDEKNFSGYLGGAF